MWCIMWCIVWCIVWYALAAAHLVLVNVKQVKASQLIVDAFFADA